MPAKKTAKKATKAKATSNYKEWPQCGICKRHIARIDEHGKAHKQGLIDERGKRTDKKGYKPGAPKKAKAAKKATKAKGTKKVAKKKEAAAAPVADAAA